MLLLLHGEIVSQSLLKMLEGLNSKEFIALLSAFSARATKDDNALFMQLFIHCVCHALRKTTVHCLCSYFRVYNIDGNGKVRSSGMLQVLRDLSGNFLTDEQRQVRGSNTLLV